MTDRLTRSDWLQQGLRTLAAEGPNALKVGAMAAKLKVSRGSFYWHFRDIADFRAQLLRSWQESTTDQVIREIAGKAEPDRLKHLLKRAFVAEPGLDRAIRSWGAQDRTVAALVAAADAERIAYIATMLAAVGMDGRRARDRAAFLYWAYLGRAVVMDPGHASIPVSALEDIGTLFES
ncbi:MAG TPA: TetR/AcrR family transcriptional regulator [Allosphingosinicella sp.]|jgi:AcrR family transcriptional regulator|nr:TetR/AcrR family transcriptional regulator [Allosphingosinicella sp.]